MGMLWEYHGALWEYSGNTMAMLLAYSRNTMGKPRSEMLRSCQQLPRMRGRERAVGAADGAAVAEGSSDEGTPTRGQRVRMARGQCR